MEPFWVMLGRPGAGFFSHFLQVVGTLAWLDARPRTTPIVYFNRLFTYWSPAGHNGSRNGWEYYFEPLSEVTLVDLLGIPDERLQMMGWEEFSKRVSPVVEFSTAHHPEITGLVGELRESQRTIASAAAGRRVRLNERVEARLREERENLLSGRNVVGVHFRGTDKHPENAQWLKLPFLGPERYFLCVDRYLDEHPGVHVFLATDCARTGEEFRDRYGSRLLSTHYRRSYDRPLHSCPDPEMGEEVLIEALLLASCDYFIHGVSNVAAGALILNPRLSHQCVYQEWLGF